MNTAPETVNKVVFPIFDYSHLQQNLKDVIDYKKGEGYSNDLNGLELKKNFIEVINELQNSQLRFDEDILLEFDNLDHTEKMLYNGLIEKEDLKNNKHLFKIDEQ